MWRHNSSTDPTVVHSSIALLQERFKQLERVKVMREERELLRGFAASAATEAAAAAAAEAPRVEQQPKWFLHTELVRPSRPLTGPPPSLRLDSFYGRYDPPEFQPLETSLSMGFNQSRPASYVKNCNGVGEAAADVDTSLHL